MKGRLTKLTSFITLIICSLTMLCGCSPSGYLSREVTVFNSELTFLGSCYGKNSKKALDEMEQRLNEIGNEVGIAIETSLISRFNTSVLNEKIEVKKYIYDMLVLSREMFIKSGGAFNIALNPLSRLWEVDIAGMKEHRNKYVENLPTIEKVREKLDLCNLDNLKLEETDGKYFISRTDYIEIDLGAIAKGYCADECARIAKKYNLESALINLAGNVYVFGDYIEYDEYKNWRIGVTPPRPMKDEDALCILDVSGGLSTVTSGDYERCYFSGDRNDPIRIPHIIDGRSGLPLGISYDEKSGEYVKIPETVYSATIINESSMLADCYATIMCLLPIEEGRALLNADEMEGLLFTSSQRRYITDGITLVDDEEFNGYKRYDKVT